MKKNATQQEQSCRRECEKTFRDCLQSGNDEVFCRIQRVPCDSGCGR